MIVDENKRLETIKYLNDFVNKNIMSGRYSIKAKSSQ